jgi:hypothetical protein
MQPAKANIDGVNRTPPLPLSPAVERKPVDNQLPPPPSARNINKSSPKVKTSTMQISHVVVILLTLVIMAVLIGLAYLAYTKSK